jgi:hypothetical protein
MKTFHDNAGRTWTVAINVNAIKRVKGLTGVNLLDVVNGDSADTASGGGRDGGLLGRLSSDPILLCDILYAACKPEADTRNVSDEDFGRSMAGDAIDAGTTALLEELVDFFPQAKRRVLDKALRKLRSLEARVIDLAERRLDSPQIDRAMEQAMADLDPPEAGAELPGSTPPDSSPSSPGSPRLTLVR